MKSKTEALITLVDKINAFGCRVTIPYSTPSPLIVLFDGDFSGASYIRVYPETLYIYGINGQVSVSDIIDVDQISTDKFVISFGRDGQASDMMVKVLN